MQKNNSKQKVGLQVAKIIKRSEKKKPLKYFDFVGTYGPTTTGSVVDFSPIPQGAGTNQRTGDEINVEYIEVRSASFCGDATNIMRVIFVRSKGQSVQSFANVLAVGNGGTYQYDSLYTPYIEKRFRVLNDKYYSMSQSGWTDCLVDHYNIPVNQKIVYQPGAITYIDGQIVLYILSDSGAAPNPAYNICARIWFRDI